ncbi:hypothetical protein SCLCIDRAFT_24080 [Scleroderma citrinum Foug A]|uniref:Uncharacterized protein n=1 Tax=Scleroderma citrinum Foug A TaxID=1036808 RepID=A0A0C2ZQ38_9AGAM|nr:hypothetical protein SCLCIDRAFT_24080 [Scleroderma citrinum Foug A]
MPEHNNFGTNSSNVQNSTPRGDREDLNENKRIARAERVNTGRRIIRVGNRRMRNPNYCGSPPPYRRHTERTRRLNETARCINWRADVIAEGDTAADLDSDLKRQGPVSTGGTWTQYVHRVSKETYERYVPGCGGARHLDRVPSEFHGGRPLQVVIPGYRSERQDALLPCIQNSHLAPKEGQILVCDRSLALVYPENPRVHWLFNGTYSLPSAKLHCYSMPHARANFIGEDPCILTYEDLALVTIPAFWIDASPEVYQPASQWDWNNWLEINFRYIWKNGSRREQISVPVMLESSGNLFEETRDQWCANSTLCHLEFDAMTLSALTNLTRLETRLLMWKPFMTLREANIELSQYLISSYPTPYWCSEPYSGKGRRVHAPEWHRHSVASICLPDSSPLVIYQRYDVIPPSMLMIDFWQVGSLLVPNYHYAMDYDLDLFFAISETWSLTDTSDSSSSIPTSPYVEIPPLNVVELIFLLELF